MSLYVDNKLNILGILLQAEFFLNQKDIKHIKDGGLVYLNGVTYSVMPFNYDPCQVEQKIRLDLYTQNG